VKLRPRIVLPLAALIALVGLGLLQPEAKAAKLFFPSFFGMERAAPGIYVDRAMPAGDRERAISLVVEARKRLERYYSTLASSSSFYFCSNDERFRSFGGTTQRAFTIGKYASVFSKGGSTIPIVAHEWSHAEMHALVGLRRMRSIPQWFDDGVAVVVSEEPSHSETVYADALKTGVPVPKLSELVSLRQWNAMARRYGNPQVNPTHLHVVYATAGHEVRGWLNQAGPAGLKTLLQDVSKGKDFATRYVRLDPLELPTGNR
jgi:hypothetical protein